MNTITITRGRLLHLCSGCWDSGLRIHSRAAGKTVLSIRPLIRAQTHLHEQLPPFLGRGRAFGFSTSSLKGEKKVQDKKRADPGVLDALQFYQSHDSSLHSLTNTIKSRIFSGPPKEEDIVAAFIACKKHARQKRISANSNAKSSPTSAILTLDDTARSITLTDVKAEWTIPSTEATELSDLAYSIITHPAVFISEPVLAAYVDLAIFLRKIANLPAAFALYAKKPYIRPGSKQPSQTYPSLPKYAIPDDIASKALDAAISAKDMELALDIINTTYGAPAYRWNKIVRKAAPAGTAALLSPAAVYILAQQAAKYQDVVDHDLAAKYAFVGMLAYLGFTGSIGLVALTTSNDQMERVTWLVGTPLSKRWLYEDERAAYDKVAQGWGFDDPNMRGFEEGPQWELLREYIAGKSMILDNPTLMEGME